MNIYRAKILDYEKWQDKIKAPYIDDNGYIEGYLIGNNVIVGDIIEFEEDYFITEFWYTIDETTLEQIKPQKSKHKRAYKKTGLLRFFWTKNMLYDHIERLEECIENRNDAIFSLRKEISDLKDRVLKLLYRRNQC